jgi:hypothetical protein
MKRVALYARVSSDAQQKEGTIASQVAELRRQIAAAGRELVKEYIDDGITGTILDRPALEELRQDAKTDLFDRSIFTRPIASPVKQRTRPSSLASCSSTARRSRSAAGTTRRHRKAS